MIAKATKKEEEERNLGVEELQEEGEEDLAEEDVA